jgi:hypothetical protein
MAIHERLPGRAACVGAFGGVTALLLDRGVVAGFQSSTDWLSGLCVVGAAAAVATIVHAIVSRP